MQKQSDGTILEDKKQGVTYKYRRDGQKNRLKPWLFYSYNKR